MTTHAAVNRKAAEELHAMVESVKLRALASASLGYEVLDYYLRTTKQPDPALLGVLEAFAMGHAVPRGVVVGGLDGEGPEQEAEDVTQILGRLAAQLERAVDSEVPDKARSLFQDYLTCMAKGG